MTEAKKKQKEKFLIAPLLVLMCAQIGTSGDNSVLSVATNELIVALDATMNDIQLANMVYSLCAGAFMVAGGMIGIIIGWKKNFRLGTLLAVLGEIAVALSPNIIFFTWVGRLLVGTGASLMIPSVLGLIPSIYKGKDRAIAFGAIGSATGIASAAGPIVAGILIDNLGFRVAFGFLAGYFSLILLASVVIPDVEKSDLKLKLDIKGIVVASIGLFLFLIGISKVSVWGLIEAKQVSFTLAGYSPAIPIALLGMAILGFLLKLEKKVEEENGCALIPQSFIKTAQVRNGLYASAVIFLYFGGLVMIINPYLQIVGGFSALKTGVTMIFMGLPLFLCSLFVPKFFYKIHPKIILRLGYLCLALAVIPFAISLQPTGVSKIFYLGMILSGIGQGLLSSQASTVVALATNERDAQQSGGIQATSRNVGQAIGVAILGMIMLYSLSSNWQAEVEASNVLSPNVQGAVLSDGMQFIGDKELGKRFSTIDMTESESEELVKINARSRMKSSQNALYAMGLISLFFVFGTNGIKQTGNMEELKEEV